MVTKALIRERLLEKLKSQKEEIRLKKSKKIKEHLFSLLEYKQAKTVMFYIATQEEVGTLAMIQETLKTGKRVVVPVTDIKNKKIIASEVRNPDTEWEIGPYRILQPKKEAIRPVASDQIDLVVVPGVGFDQQGNRLGRGQGYFDRFLAALSAKTKKIGVAFDFQLLDNIPTHHHDIPVHKVVTA